MDKEDFFQRRITGLMSRALAVPGLPEELGLTGLGERWEGPEGSDRPGWYVWLAGRAGAYELLLAGLGADRPESAWACGHFLVKYYPKPDEPVFAGFSARERRLVTGGHIGPAGTPRLEAQTLIDDSAFAVGVVDVALALDDSAARLAISSLDRIRAWPDQGGSPARPDRDVPALALVHPLLPVLAGAAAVGMDARAVSVHATSGPGFGFRVTGAGPAPVPDPAVRLEEIRVSLARPEAEVAWPAGFAETADDGACRRLDWRRPSPPPVLPEPWQLPAICWSGAEARHHHLTGTCHCCMG